LSAGGEVDAVGQTFLSAGGEVDAVGQTFLSAGGEVDGAHQPQVEITRRRLPHWQLAGSSYFVTFRLARGSLAPTERAVVLNHVKSGHGKWYSLFAIVVMPDHVHVLLKPNDGITLSRITKGVKGVTARLINQARHSRGSIWQDESWDRIIRNQEEFDEKLQYMLENPVKAGLVEDPWGYDGWFHQPCDVE
jgi:putative transposase